MKKTSYDDKIIELKSYAEKLESVRNLYNYFEKIKNNQNCFVVEMRRLVANDLADLGFRVCDIALITSRHQSSIIYINKGNVCHEVAMKVLYNYKNWISQELYPISVREKTESFIHKGGIATKVRCELINL